MVPPTINNPPSTASIHIAGFYHARKPPCHEPRRLERVTPNPCTDAEHAALLGQRR
jgi:hypothetical protein